MVRIKAQFMLISAVIAGLLMITVGSVITDLQDRTYEPEDMSYEIQYIQEEASKVTTGGSVSQLDRSNFERTVSEMDYRYSVDYWERPSGECINVTLESPDTRVELECLE